MGIGDKLKTKKLTLDGHDYVIRRPTTTEGIAWFNGLPDIEKKGGLSETGPEPEKINQAIRAFLVSVDGEQYNAETDPPETAIPFGIALVLYNSIYAIAVPAGSAEQSRRIL